MVLLLLVAPVLLKGQSFSLRAGIYEFTDVAAREFYVLAPTLMVGYDVWKKSRMSLEVSTGLSFNSVKYNDHKHYLYMVPVCLTFQYHLPNPDAKVHPVIGAGMSLLGKADVNKDFDKTHYSLAYGYHARGGLHILVKQKAILMLELSYHLILPPVSEDLGLSGILLTAGIRLPFRSIP